jgi:Ulp1 family protease
LNCPSVFDFQPASRFIFCRTVPYQNNTWDCGVFVCRYAYAIHQLRDRHFTYKDAGMYCDSGDKKTKQAFYHLITDGAEFDFDMSDIARFREEFKILIERLSDTFLQWKKTEKAEQRELKASAIEKPEAAKGEAAEQELPPSSGKEIKDVLI